MRFIGELEVATLKDLVLGGVHGAETILVTGCFTGYLDAGAL